MKLISGNANQTLAKAIAEHLDLPLAEAEFRRFKDNEIFVEIIDVDTFRDVAYFSHRRSVREAAPDYGRYCAAISLG